MRAAWVVLISAGCAGSPPPPPDPVPVHAGASPVEPVDRPAPVRSDEGEVVAGVEDWAVRWKVRLLRADGTVEQWDPSREPFHAEVAGWRCEIGQVSSSRSVAVVNGRVRNRGEESRVINCRLGAKVEVGTARCGWDVGAGSSEDELLPVDEATLALDVPGARHELVLRCEVGRGER